MRSATRTFGPDLPRSEISSFIRQKTRAEAGALSSRKALYFNPVRIGRRHVWRAKATAKIGPGGPGFGTYTLDVGDPAGFESQIETFTRPNVDCMNAKHNGTSSTRPRQVT